MNELDNEQILQLALKKIESLEQQLDSQNHQDKTSIVGMSVQLPGRIHSLYAMDAFLRERKTAFNTISSDRWVWEKYYKPSSKGKNGSYYTNKGCFIDDIYSFDAGKFHMSAAEAIELDPQHRLMLEQVNQLVEEFEQNHETLRGKKVGLFAAFGGHDYALANLHHPDLSQINHFGLLGNTHSLGAGRIAYTFDFKGPVIYLDTSCSSTLTLIHLARQSLATGSCDYAIVAASNLLLSPHEYIGFCELNALSVQGKCLPFDASADGYVRGEGVGALLLMQDGVAQTKQIPRYANICGSAFNHDGQSNGLTAPNVASQMDVLKAALKNANLSPEKISHIEAHGTGTKLGDPIEMQAVAQVYGDNPGYISSIKGNIGHLEQAAGIASILKSIAILQYQTIYPQAVLDIKNPYIAWDKQQYTVPTEVLDKRAPIEYVALSGFGMSGTNVHIILQKADMIQQLPKQVMPSDKKTYRKPLVHDFTPNQTKSKQGFEEHLVFKQATMPAAYMILDAFHPVGVALEDSGLALSKVKFNQFVTAKNDIFEALSVESSGDTLKLVSNDNQLIASAQSSQHAMNAVTMPSQLSPHLSKTSFYQKLNQSGLNVHGSFQRIEHIFATELGYMGLVKPNHHFDFQTLDSIFQVASVAWPWEKIASDSCYIPISIDSICLKGDLSGLLFVLAKPTSSHSSNILAFDIDIWDQQYQLCGQIKHMQFIWHQQKPIAELNPSLNLQEDKLQSLLVTIKSAIAKNTGCEFDRIENTLTLDKLGVDSIMALDIADDIEAATQVKLSLRVLNPSSTVESIVEIIKSHSAEKTIDANLNEEIII